MKPMVVDLGREVLQLLEVMDSSDEDGSGTINLEEFKQAF